MGLNYSAGVTADGRLYTWGEGNYHKLGHGDVKPVLRPKLVEALKDIQIVKVACGYVLCDKVWGGGMVTVRQRNT